MIDLTPIIQALIGLLAAWITWKVIPWIQARTTKQQQDNLQAVVQTLVYAAEMLYGANKGEEKLDYVISWLDAHGYKADRADIEAAVYKAFHDLKAIADAVPVEMDASGQINLNIAYWSLEQLKSFCQLNEIPTDGCLTREDYMDAIEAGAKGGRVSDEPPDSAAESREE